MTMTTPIGKVKNKYQGMVPRAVLSFKASSTKIDATRLKSKGENPKITPPSTSGVPRLLARGGGGGGGEGKMFSSDTTQP